MKEHILILICYNVKRKGGGEREREIEGKEERKRKKNYETNRIEKESDMT